MFCINCGNEISGNSNFCSSCGTSLNNGGNYVGKSIFLNQKSTVHELTKKIYAARIARIFIDLFGWIVLAMVYVFTNLATTIVAFVIMAIIFWIPYNSAEKLEVKLTKVEEETGTKVDIKKESKYKVINAIENGMHIIFFIIVVSIFFT